MASKLIINNEWMGRDFTVKLHEARTVRLTKDGPNACLRGIKSWALTNGFEYNHFRTVGLTASEAVRTGDIRVQVAVLKLYRERLKNGF